MSCMQVPSFCMLGHLRHSVRLEVDRAHLVAHAHHGALEDHLRHERVVAVNGGVAVEKGGVAVEKGVVVLEEGESALKTFFLF